MAITKDDLRRLLQAGYTSQELMEMARSNPQQLQSLASRTTNGKLLPKPAFSRDPFSPLPQSSGNVGGTAVRAARPQTSIGGAIKGSALGQIFSNLAKSPLRKNIAEQIVNPALNTARGIMGQSARGIGAQAVGKMGAANPANQQGGFDDFGELPTFDAPELQYRDFTGEAQSRVGGVYAPRYAAIDQAAQNAQGQYNRSDQITKGLYENLAKSIGDIAARTAAQYKDAQATQAGNTDQLVKSQGENYSSAQNQEAALLERLGQGEAAAQVLGDNTAEQAYQQSQSQAMGNAQQAALTQQGQTQQDYYSNMGNANQTAGVSARQDLIAQLGNVLQGYDRDRMNLQGDQAQAALQLAQQLSDRDFQAQQANYGIARDEYSSQVDAQKFAFERAMQQAQMAAQQSEIQRNQANIDRQFEFDQQKYGTDLATAMAQQRLDEQKLIGQQGAASSLNFDQQDPVSRTVQQIASAAGGDTSKGAQYYDFVRQATASFAAQGMPSEQIAALIGNQFAFTQQIANQARAKGLDPLVAQAAAASYWQNILGKK